MLVISDLNEYIEYSIPISFIVTLATFSDVNEALKAKSSFHLSRAWQSIRPVLPLASRKNLCKASHKFFKWIKQHLQVKRFYGESENAVRIRIHIASSPTASLLSSNMTLRLAGLLSKSYASLASLHSPRTASVTCSNLSSRRRKIRMTYNSVLTSNLINIYLETPLFKY